MLTVSCRDVGVDCDYVCKGETEEEIMKNKFTQLMQQTRLFISTVLTIAIIVLCAILALLGSTSIIFLTAKLVFVGGLCGVIVTIVIIMPKPISMIWRGPTKSG